MTEKKKNEMHVKLPRLLKPLESLPKDKSLLKDLKNLRRLEGPSITPLYPNKITK